MTSQTASSIWRSNWMPILIMGALMVSITMGVRQSFALFLLPISAEIGEGRSVFSFAIAVQNLMWGLASPIFGAMADRYGAKPVALAGGAIYMTGMVIMAGLVTPAGLILAQALVGMGLASAGISIALGAVARATPRHQQALALGLVTSFGSFGQFLMVPISQLFIDGFGWQIALVLMAGMSGGIIASAYFLRADSAQDTAKTADLAKLKSTDMLGVALRSQNYILLTVGFFVCGIQVVFIGTHLPTYLRDMGMSSEIASWSLSLIGLFNIIGSFLCGWLGGIYSKRKVLALVYLLRSVFIIAFISLPASPSTALIFGAGIGLLWLGTIPLTSGLIVAFFGPAHLSMLYGVAFLSHQIGSFLGAWLGGFLYDISATYTVMWWVSILTGLFAFIVNWLITEQEEGQKA